MIKKLICVCGVTCSGKDTFVERAAELYPRIVGTIQVGKEMRLRHPPEYFKGLGAMADTEPETWAIFDEQYKRMEGQGKSIIFVSGMPRLKGQVEKLQRYCDPTFLFLYVSEDVLSKRLDERFKNNPSARELSIKRMVNDKIQLYDIMMEIGEGIISLYCDGNMDSHIGHLIHG